MCELKTFNRVQNGAETRGDEVKRKERLIEERERGGGGRRRRCLLSRQFTGASMRQTVQLIMQAVHYAYYMLHYCELHQWDIIAVAVIRWITLAVSFNISSALYAVRGPLTVLATPDH